MRTGFLTFLLLLVFTAVAGAQATCPPATLIDLSRSASTCYGLRGEALCAGNGDVTVTLMSAASAPALPGDRFDLATVREIRLTTTGDELATAYVTLRGNLAASDAATLFLFGDAQITNMVDFPTVTLNAVARGTVILRAQPNTESAELERLGVNDGVLLDGRVADGTWLRTLIGGATPAWLAAGGVNVAGDARQLAVIDPAAAVLRPLQAFTLTTGDSSFCAGGLVSGALLQTANPLELSINGTAVTLTGTYFLQANPVPRVFALHGQGMVGGDFIAAGASVFVGEAVLPYPFDLVSGLPINNLPVRVSIAQPITEDELAAAARAYLAARQIAAATPIPVTPVDTICRRRVIRITTLYGGPGDFYEAINDVAEGTLLNPILQTTDPDGNVWWQLTTSSWIPASRVAQTGDCPPIPVAAVAPIPTINTLSLETCESTNGAIRAGQQVTIQFTPPPFDNYGEARDATRIDPGRIIIGSRTYRASATEPIRLGTADERYLRRFYLVWRAEPGTYRIEGFRLHYNPICAITVPVG